MGEVAYGPNLTQATVFPALWGAHPAEAGKRLKDDLVRSGYIVLAVPARAQALNPLDWDR